MSSRYLDVGDAIPLRPVLAKALATRIPSRNIAAKAGRDDALFLQQLEFQLKRVGGKDHDGHHWVYNGRKDWADQLAMGEDEFRTCRDRLVRDGFVIAIENPENKFFKERWYRIDYTALDAYLDEHLPESLTNRLGNGTHPIGDGSPMERGWVPNRPGTDPHTNTETTNREDKQRRQPKTETTSARVREADDLAENALEFFVDHRNAHGLGRPEYRNSDLGEDEWFDTMHGLVTLHGLDEVKSRIEEAVLKAEKDPGLQKALSVRNADQAFAGRWDQFRVMDTTKKSRAKQKQYEAMLDQRMQEKK